MMPRIWWLSPTAATSPSIFTLLLASLLPTLQSVSSGETCPGEVVSANCSETPQSLLQRRFANLQTGTVKETPPPRITQPSVTDAAKQARETQETPPPRITELSVTDAAKQAREKQEAISRDADKQAGESQQALSQGYSDLKRSITDAAKQAGEKIDIGAPPTSPALPARSASPASPALPARPASPTTPAPPTSPASPQTGALPTSQATSSDLINFLCSFIFNCTILAGCALFFCLARLRYPKLYSNGWLAGRAPWSPGDGLFSWVWASLQLKTSDVNAAAGLDAAMMLEFLQLGMKVSLHVGLPMVLFMCPAHFFWGIASEGDFLSRIDISNLPDGSRIYWLHAAAVWMSVVAVQKMIWAAQAKFVTLRYEWLINMPEPRALTCLVRNIPQEYCSDSALRDYTQDLFQQQVASAYVVRHLPESLTTGFQKLQDSQQKLLEAERQWESNDRDPAKRPKHRVGACESDIIDDCRVMIRSIAAEMRVEQATIATSVEADNFSVCSTDGFVTFHHRRDVEMALTLRPRAKPGEIVFSTPPDPADVRYEVLQQDHEQQYRDTIIAYVLLTLMYFSYLPIVFFISVATKLETLGFIDPTFNGIAVRQPVLTAMWDGLAGVTALALFTSFVPTILMLIIKNFLGIPSERACQIQLARWYFCFQVTFVLLIFCIGNSLFGTYLRLLASPADVFYLLASTLPHASHFFFNYFPYLWVAHFVAICRFWNLMRFLIYRRSHDDESAYELCEPEDQDYYGMGLRSSHFSLVLVIFLVFCSISPMLCILLFADCLLCRIAYGYLFVFAESKKVDTGGDFWCTQLKHVQSGLVIYITLMVGILIEKSGARGPSLVTSLCYIYLFNSWRRFDQQFAWARLPLDIAAGIETDSGTEEPGSTSGQYVQPELVRVAGISDKAG